MSITKYNETIYAGVLGKIIGVYLGRPVEGWAYEKIISEFDEVRYYVHDKLGVPLVVSDDDISGTFGFFRALEDKQYNPNITAKDIGDTWLNYIIEDKTILWWGGLGRSTEHTAYLRLKEGIHAPKSGSIEMNGQTLAEQIGAQIFIDAFAMACPNDPEKAVDLIKKAASVSHDGLALEAACHLGGMQAMAFEEKNLDILLDENNKYVKDELLKKVIYDVRDICSRESNWRKVREFLDERYGYDVFPGACHMVPNHSMVLASLLLGGDDFQKSISIASSAGWDTDCNAGNVGCLNGIRLGLDGINKGADFRKPVSDLMYVVTSDGGSVVTDAVIESKKIIKAAAALKDEKIEMNPKKYTFEFTGSTQGFALCPYSDEPYQGAELCNLNETEERDGLVIQCKNIGDGVSAYASTPTFMDFSSLSSNFETIASPTLYSTQKVVSNIEVDQDKTVKMYILYYDINDQVQRAKSEEYKLKQGLNKIEWDVPQTDGMPIFRVGVEVISSERYSGRVILLDMDFVGAPKEFAQRGMLMTSIWGLDPHWLQIWASSAKYFAPDFNHTYCITHNEENGLATIGSSQWDNYRVTSKLICSLHEEAGLVVRSKGHRQYYGAVLSNYNTAKIYVRKDEKVDILAQVPFDYKEDILYDMTFEADGNKLKLSIDQKVIIETEDKNNTYTNGGAGFIVSKGTVVAEDFIVNATE